MFIRRFLENWDDQPEEFRVITLYERQKVYVCTCTDGM